MGTLKVKARAFFVFSLAAVVTFLAAACGGSDATATPQPGAKPALSPTPRAATPTAAPAATAQPGVTPRPTAAPLQPTSTQPPPTVTQSGPTPTPRPAATAVPPTPTNLAGKRGGVLQLPAISSQPQNFDLYDTRGGAQAGHEIFAPNYNNIIQPDPYADGAKIEGDAAERWEVGDNGKRLTFYLRRGIKFHDGMPLTARDVAYNLDRTINQRAGSVMHFRTHLQPIQKIETTDEFTVQLTLSRYSSAVLQVLATNTMVIYPAHIPIPEKFEDFRKNPIGSGPYKVRSVNPGTRIEHIRNTEYWKPGLPYLDGIVLTPMATDLVIASFRSGRLDATVFNAHQLTPSVVRILEREQKFQSQPALLGLTPIHLNQREPWTNAKVRQAFTLALDRHAIWTIELEQAGTPYASPLLPPELGGQWGISTEALKNRPGFRADKTADLARGKQLLAEAGVNPASFTVIVRATSAFVRTGEVAEATLRSLGFKTSLVIGDSVQERAAVSRGDFDAWVQSASMTFDDPYDYLANWVRSDGSLNLSAGKWSNPEIDRLLLEQDGTVDLARRKQLLTQLQNIILDEPFGGMIPAVYRAGYIGNMPWVKNYPPRLPLLHSPRYRWEQVWLER